MSASPSTRLTDRLVRVRLAFGQCWMWRDGSEITLVDSGPPGSGPVIAAALAELGLDTSAVTRLVLTHHHVDHVGSAAEIRAWGAQVWAHRADAPVVRGELDGPVPPLLPAEEPLWAEITGAGPMAAPPCPVDRELVHGDTVPMGGGAVVVHGPGHTPGSIGVHLPGPRVLFTGDTVAEQGGALVLGPFNLDRTVAAESFRLLAGLDSDIACFGHGEPVTAAAGARLRAVAGLGPFAG